MDHGEEREGMLLSRRAFGLLGLSALSAGLLAACAPIGQEGDDGNRRGDRDGGGRDDDGRNDQNDDNRDDNDQNDDNQNDDNRDDDNRDDNDRDGEDRDGEDRNRDRHGG